MPSRAVGGALGDPLAAGNGDFDDRVDAGAEPRGDFFEIGADHRARRGIDRGLAHRQRQARPGHRAHAFAGLEAHARAGRRKAHGRDDQRAMGDVGIVARVLDDAGAGEIGAKLVGREGEFRPQPFGSATGTGSGNWPVSSASKAARARRWRRRPSSSRA